MNKGIKDNTANKDSLLSRLMSRSLVRFGAALFLASIVTLVTILMMKTFIDDYDDVASDAIVRIFKLQTVTLADSDYKAIPHSAYANEGRDKTNSPEDTNISTRDEKSSELQEILRKKKEIISILEKE